MNRNIVLICLDSVRSDYFEDFAPRITDRADVTLSECRAASSWTTPSHASIFTGNLPHQHGIHAYNRNYSTISTGDTFLSNLPSHDTLAVSSNIHLSECFDFDTLFDYFVDATPRHRFKSGMDARVLAREGTSPIGTLRKSMVHDNTIASLLNALYFKIDADLSKSPVPKLFDDGAKLAASRSLNLINKSKEPFFLFLNLMEAHGPLQHIRGFDKSLHSASWRWHSSQFDGWKINTDGITDNNRKALRINRELYAAAIDYLDRNVISLIDKISDEADGQTTFIITADHGQNLAEDENNPVFGHQGSLSEELLHVPCQIINLPEECTVTRTDERFSQLQLGDLITALVAGEDYDVGETASSCPAEVIGAGGLGSNLNKQEQKYWDRMIRTYYSNNIKYVWDTLGNVDCYDISAGSRCREDLVETDCEIPERASHLFDWDLEYYQDHIQNTNKESENMSESVAERLRELGYLET